MKLCTRLLNQEVIHSKICIQDYVRNQTGAVSETGINLETKTLEVIRATHNPNADTILSGTIEEADVTRVEEVTRTTLASSKANVDSIL